MTGVFTLGDHILSTLKRSGEAMTARQVWEHLGKPGAESSIGCRLATLRLEGYVYRARQGSGDFGDATLWRAAP